MSHQSFLGLGVGGPYLIYYVTPTEEELFKASHMTPRFWSLSRLLTLGRVR